MNAGVLRDNAQDTPEGDWSVVSARLRHGKHGLATHLTRFPEARTSKSMAQPSGRDLVVDSARV
jgi:hypothetical protein